MILGRGLGLSRLYVAAPYSCLGPPSSQLPTPNSQLPTPNSRLAYLDRGWWNFRQPRSKYANLIRNEVPSSCAGGSSPSSRDSSCLNPCYKCPNISQVFLGHSDELPPLFPDGVFPTLLCHEYLSVGVLRFTVILNGKFEFLDCHVEEICLDTRMDWSLSKHLRKTCGYSPMP